MPMSMGPQGGAGIRELLMQLLQGAGEIPGKVAGPLSPVIDDANLVADEIMSGGARDDGVMGAMPMVPPAGAFGGMASRLRNVGKLAGRSYQGSAPIAGSSGVPHTSELPNAGAPKQPPSGGPAGGGFGDNMSGTIRGNIEAAPGFADDFAAMDVLDDVPTTGRNNPMGPGATTVRGDSQAAADLVTDKLRQAGATYEEIAHTLRQLGFHDLTAGNANIPF